ncbi:hypothetical protein GCM10008090_00190 [Arenicella chitinivorans]|uniref:Uncharacterized protein n=1 Tax=Arenicella chitinivorans TaxID=1329800 RepID=A0A918RFI9_9GAMM|nr:peptidoglycan-binding domain-containing protein [Arenicella chitinivorans]GGZ95971.1 hypothetical protein GCM10008090_00190 [Arenicella chitinivorans]
MRSVLLIVTNSNLNSPIFALALFLFAALFLSSCQRSQPSPAQIQSYVEGYQVAHDFKVASMDYDVSPEGDGGSGTIRVSGKLELREPLYVEDLGSKNFRKRVATMLRRNRFSEREINHEIYDRVIRATARVPGRENEYYTFLKQEYAPGYAINFSADLRYTQSSDGYVLDGLVNHPKLQGSRMVKFTNPIVDDTKLVERAVKAVLDEQARYREMMKASSAVLNQLWDAEHGLIVWNRKLPYLGNENLSAVELTQLQEFREWRGVYRISNIKPVQFNTPHASNFFELGSYTTEGVATCLRQTGFARELTYPKSRFEEYCEFGEQYPVEVHVASLLNKTNEFEASVAFKIGDLSSGELTFSDPYFQHEDNDVGRYSDQLRVVFLESPFDLRAHNRPAFQVVSVADSDDALLRLQYTGSTDYAAADADRALAESPLIAATSSAIVDAGTQDMTSQNDNDSPTAQAPSLDDSERSNAPLTQIELVKAIQLELKRLKIYNARIDGIAGEQTFWAMGYVQKQLGVRNIAKPSQAFLELLQATPVTAIPAPAEPYKAKAREPEKKKTLGNWFSGLFKKKDKTKD